jgi:hypothetical protein
MISIDIEKIKQGFVERLVDELNPLTDHDRKIIELRYYEAVGQLIATAKIERYVPLIAYRKVKEEYSSNGNGNGRK